MAGVGLGVLFAGYSLTYYGLTQLGVGAPKGQGGGNWGLLDLMVPSRWAKAASTPRDGGKGDPGTAASGVLGDVVHTAQTGVSILHWLNPSSWIPW